ncbi:MAG: hypothetical protein ACI37T_01280, partial [Candidatus Gastranaerophilaceae bacterium]
MKKFLISSAITFLIAGIATAADLTVESDTQHFKDSEHKIDLKGNVKVKLDNINVESPVAEVIINPTEGKVEKVKFLENAYSYQINAEKKHEVK